MRTITDGAANFCSLFLARGEGDGFCTPVFADVRCEREISA
jgi:hypothetical protein